MNKPCSVRIFFMVAILSFSVTSCSYFEKKEASKAVSEFMEACIAEDYLKMRELYPSLFYNFPETMQRIDSFKIDNIEYESKYNIKVSIKKLYADTYGNFIEKKATLIVGKDSISMLKRDMMLKNGFLAVLGDSIDKENKFVNDRLVIYDSYGFSDTEDDKYYMVGKKIYKSLPSKTDCEKMYLNKAGHLFCDTAAYIVLINTSNLLSTKSNINFSNGFWYGDMVVKNISRYPFKNVKYELYGMSNNEKHFLACDDICNDEFSPEESIKIPILVQGSHYPVYTIEYVFDKKNINDMCADVVLYSTF